MAKKINQKQQTKLDYIPTETLEAEIAARKRELHKRELKEEREGRMAKRRRQALQMLPDILHKEQEEYSISWYHNSFHGKGNDRGKMRFFGMDKDRAIKFYNDMAGRYNNNQPYEQGLISHLTKNNF